MLKASDYQVVENQTTSVTLSTITCIPVLLVPECGEEEPADGGGGVAADHEEVAAGGKGRGL